MATAEMSVTESDRPSDQRADQSGAPCERVRLTKLAHSIEHASHYLPAQGPITVFIHHNTLHAFEDYSFDEGVQRGARLFGCEPYLPERRYRQLLQHGRITAADIEAVLLADLSDGADQLLGLMGTRFHLRQAMLHYELQSAPPAELAWFIAETDALSRMRRDVDEETRVRFVDATKRWTLREHYRDGKPQPSAYSNEGPNSQAMHEILVELVDEFGGALDQWSDDTWERFALAALWRICQRGSAGAEQAIRRQPIPNNPGTKRLSEQLRTATGRDADELVNEVLIRFTSAFLDQGLAHWALPHRELGFFKSFAALYKRSGAFGEAWLAPLGDELQRLDAPDVSPLEIIDESLTLLGVAEDEREEYLIGSLLSLRGWAGMVRQVEVRGDSVAKAIPEGSLVEYLAVRLLLERLALEYLAQDELGYRGPLAKLGEAIASREVSPVGSEWSMARTGARAAHSDVNQRAFTVFQLAQTLGWLPPALARLNGADWSVLIAEIEAFHGIERRRVLQAALERRYRVQTLDALTHRLALPPAPRAKPKFQVVCCLDEREESFRRHLEEIAPEMGTEVETFGAAGFFSVAMYYRGASDAHFRPLCPIVVTPRHWVIETATESAANEHERQRVAHKTIGAASHRVHQSSRTFLGGALVAPLGVAAGIALVARVLFPRWTAQLRKLASRLIAPPPATELQLERQEEQSGQADGHPNGEEHPIGFTLPEMAAIVRRLLDDIGASNQLSRLMIFAGHGSSSLNNPHRSAYDCGACGGGSGGPNARAIARMGNDPRVRALLAEGGLKIPDDTIFVGAFHNTCDDSVTWFDVETIPETHREEFAAARWAIDQARQRNAHERSRRFVSASLSMPPEAALRHVEARSEDLSQVRPECGHASNAVCYVGRRSRIRGLYLDRRAFLVSYDPLTDDSEQAILTRILQAVIPVCAGISLEYYFSYVDNVGFGCGSKLPHNITSLLGVMDGAGSDLRTGLPWQMVEIHDPLRLLFVIEATPAAMNGILDRNPALGKVCRNGWVQLATLDPHTQALHVLRGDTFELYRPESKELPRSPSSIDWYRGLREHLGFALIQTEAAD